MPKPQYRVFGRWSGPEQGKGSAAERRLAAHTPHGYDRFSEDFAVWVVFYGPEK